MKPRIHTPRSHGWTGEGDRPTFGPQAAAVSDALGLPFTPWQQFVADVALEYELDDVQIMHGGVVIYTLQVPRLIYREVRLWVPRQSGKTVLLLAVMVWRCMFAADEFYPDDGRDGAPDFAGRRAQWVTFFSTHGQHAKHKFEDEFTPLLEDCAVLAGEFVPRNQNGHEAFMWANNALLQLGSGSEKAGHGDPLDMVCADEFFAQVDNRIEDAARPTGQTRRSPQLWFVSTFGNDDEDARSNISGPLWVKVEDSRERCRTGAHGTVASFEYSAADYDDPDTMDYGDEQMWIDTMPGLQVNGGIIPISAIRADYDAACSAGGTTTLSSFKRGYLNLRPKRGKEPPPPLVTAAQWADIVDEESELRRGAKGLGLGIDIEIDNEGCALVVCGDRGGDVRHLENVRSEQATVATLIDEVARLLVREPIKAVGVHAAGATANVMVELEEVCKRARVELIKLVGREWYAACESMRSGTVEQTISNNGSRALQGAVSAAIKKPHGDLWEWERAYPAAQIAPLKAATAALRAYETVTIRKKKSAYEEDT